MRAGAGVARSGLGDVPKAAAASLGAQCASAASLTMSEPVLVTASDADSVRSAVTAFAATAALPGVRQFAVFMPPLMLVWRCATACCVHATLDACVKVWGSFAVIMPPLMLVSRCAAACCVHATPDACVKVWGSLRCSCHPYPNACVQSGPPDMAFAPQVRHLCSGSIA